MQELAEITSDVVQFRKALQQGDEECIPDRYVKRLIQGEHAIRVWRAYHHITQKTLAEQAGIDVPHLVQIENGTQTASLGTLKKLATVLRVAIDDII